MTDTKALRGLLEKATPAPWNTFSSRWKVVGNGSPSTCEAIERDGKELIQWAGFDDAPNAKNNAALIAAMRNALPDLLDAYEERDRLKAALVQIATLQAENEKLREATQALLDGCIEEYGDPDEGEHDESVGWNGDGTHMKFTYGLMQDVHNLLKGGE